MCGRRTLTKQQQEIIEEYTISNWENSKEYQPNYNIAPTNSSPVLLFDDNRTIKNMRWGLRPFWADDKSIGQKMINARSETLHEKNSFRPLINNKRCIVISDGYYEWKGKKGNKQPYYIKKPNHGFISMAGLWSEWKNNKDESVYSYTIITTPPSEEISDIHNRMPAILPQDKIDQWLNVADYPYKKCSELLEPYNNLEYYSVSRYVNSVDNNSKKCIKPQPSIF